jgi:putative (di)nucleoside polyphosphate hydrolase
MRKAKAAKRPKLKSKKSKISAKPAKKLTKLPYRPCAGITLFNRHGEVFVGRREGGPEHMDPTHIWQMPQGGIDEGEDAYEAALRELYEETNIRSVKKLGAIGGWLTYDLPPHLVGTAWKGKYRGQKQKWFALLFTGEDREIDVRHPGGGKHKPEFVEWRWEPIGNLTTVVVPFKRKTYQRIVKEFRKFAKPFG